MWRLGPDDAVAESSPLQCHRFADAVFDEASGELRVAGVVVQVERLPLQLLNVMLRRADEVVTKEELCDLLWSGRPMGENVLANAVSKLRRALGEDAGRHIVTLQRIGYRLAGPVESSPAGTQALRADVLKPGQPVPGREGYVLDRRLNSNNRRPVWLARHAKTHDAKVFKLADDSLGLAALKREFDGYRLLRAALGEGVSLVRLLDANLLTPPFYLECEYQGSDLMRWADEAGRLGTVPWAERLDLFMQIARTVAAAHAIGLLHRDVRPAHVWVRGESGAWAAAMTDFASAPGAEAVRSEGFDEPGQPLPPKVYADLSAPSGGDGHERLYLAPELLAGQVPTQQGDLYALGVILYQLWIADLRRPLLEGWESELATEACLCDDIRAATASDPELRLGSVAELVQRLTRLDARREHGLQLQHEALRNTAARVQLQSLLWRRPWELAAALVLGLLIGLWLGGAVDRSGGGKRGSLLDKSGSQS